MEGTYRQSHMGMEKELGDLYFVVKFGATGLPQLLLWSGLSQTYSIIGNDGGTPATYGPVANVSIKRISAGLYQVTLGAGGIPRILDLDMSWQGTTGLPTITNVEVVNAAPPQTYATGTNSFQFQLSAPAATTAAGTLAAAFTGTAPVPIAPPIAAVAAAQGSWGGTNSAVFTQTTSGGIVAAAHALAGGMIFDTDTTGIILDNTACTASSGTITVFYSTNLAPPFGVPSDATGIGITPPIQTPTPAGTIVVSGSATTAALVATDPASGEVGIFRLGFQQGLGA